jgi:5,10-methylene-tetrahydrofolate dehydrogenase/methenyl tetrahydrofolate cyclohydrolase
VYLTIIVILTIFVVIPSIKYFYARAWHYFDPLRFNMQHVIIIGGSDGLGKELVKEVFMKGALVTIIGRDENKMKTILEELDN